MNKIILLLLVLIISVNFSFAISRVNKAKLLKNGIKFQDGDLANTKDGMVRGTSLATHKVFYGIPFARPPTGDLRFADPQPTKPWKHIRDATAQKPQCIQDCQLGDAACSDLVHSEDCLYLDVFVPKELDETQLVEVMVFVPGGAFTQGTGACPLYDSTMFASSNIIVVNVNYRLGVLGFMATDSLSGNFGFLDQVRALQWVRDNINEFGGDKEKVTLYGQSAGAFSVAAHLVSDLSKGLFHRAILSSTPLTVGLKDKTNNIAKGFAQRYSNQVGCQLEDIICHRSKSHEEVLAAQLKVKYIFGVDKILDAFTIWSPVVDGIIINGQPLTEIQYGRSHDVPTIIGDVQDEATLFVFMAFKDKVAPESYPGLIWMLFPANVSQVQTQYPCSGSAEVDCRPALARLLNDYLFRCSGRYHLNKLVEFHDSPVYHYHYQHIGDAKPVALFCEGLVCHGAELPMIFNTHETAMGSGLPAEEVQLAIDLNNYWVNFVKTGNPSDGIVTDTMPVWEPTTLTKNITLVIDIPIETKDLTTNDAKCDMFDKLTYRSYTKVPVPPKKSKKNTK